MAARVKGNSKAALRIFLSYGRDEHAVDALAIKRDLEARGHQVWFDVERLRPGVDWEHYIEDGLRWCDKVVLVVTPYSVRRRDPMDPASRDGYCLNEIAKAIERNKLIIPVVLVSVEQGLPTSICRIQYLDMTGCVPFHLHPEKYRARFDRLVDALENDRLDFEGGHAWLMQHLKPLDFDPEISRHISAFVGRQRLIDQFDSWAANTPDSRLFWLVGRPGAGKTAFSSYLCHRRGAVVASHFTVYGHAEKSSAHRMLLSLAFQLSTHLPEYYERLKGMDLGREALRDPQTAVDTLFVEPLSRGFPHPGRSLVLVVDAVDEASAGGRNEIASVLASLHQKTPAWLKLFITSRADQDVFAPLQAVNPVVMDASSEDNRNDLRKYLRRQLSEIGTQRVEDAVARLVDLSEGLFLYAVVVLQELREGRISLDDLGAFPRGLGSYYTSYFQRQFPDLNDYDRRLRPLFEVIGAERAPLPLSVLALAAECDVFELRRRVQSVGSLLSIRQSGAGQKETDVVQPLHRSLIEWLAATDAVSGGFTAARYAVDNRKGAASLAQACWSEYQRGRESWSNYTAAHLATHLIEAERWSDLRSVIEKGDFGLINRWINRGQLAEGIDCLSKVIAHVGTETKDSDFKAGLATQVARMLALRGEYERAEQWIRNALKWASFFGGRRQRAVAWHERASLSFYQGDLARAEKGYRRALRLCNVGSEKLQAEASANLVALSTIELSRHRFDNAIKLAGCALEKALVANDTSHAIAARRILANAFKDTGRYEQAEEHLNPAELAAAVASLETERASLALLRGWLNYNRAILDGHPIDAAIRWFDRARETSERCFHIHCFAEARLGLLWCNLAAIKPEDSKRALDELIAGPFPGQHRGLTAMLKLGEGAVSHQLGRLNDAQSVYEAALSYSREFKQHAWEAGALVGLGSLRWHRGEFLEAEHCWAKAVVLAAPCSPIRLKLVERAIENSRSDPRSAIL